MLLEVKVPEAGFSVTEGTVLEWQKKVGDTVNQGDILVAIETDKVSMEIPASASGVIREIRFQTGQVAPVGGVLAVIETAAAGAAPPAGGPGAAAAAGAAPASAPGPAASTHAPAGAMATGIKGKRVSPLAKALARKNGLDLSGITEGSGPDGRIVRDDVLRLAAAARNAEAAGSAPSRAETLRPPGGTEAALAGPAAGPAQKIPFSGWRKVIAEKMLASARSIPHYTMSIDIDVTDLASLIEQSRRDEKGPRLTYLPFLMKAMCLGIAAVPEVNAACFEDGYVLQQGVHIGIAVDLGEKLLVPVIRDVTEKSILQLAAEIQETVRKAREDRLQLRDMEGASITLTNVGVYHIHSGTSIITPPQVAILYMGVVREAPAVVGGAVAVRKMMMVGGTFDHRLVNGGPGARFLDLVRGNLESLNRLVLALR